MVSYIQNCKYEAGNNLTILYSKLSTVFCLIPFIGKSTATIVLLSDIGGENTGEKICQMMAKIPNTR